jgi:hypothetical protein
MARLSEDLRRLSALGVPAVTFADEDFLGGSLDDVETFAEGLAEIATRVDIPPFDVSATIRSIHDAHDDPTSRRRKEENLQLLRDAGLRKIFLGIESGSPSQLRRYCKGHTVDECIAASKVVIGAGLRLELGFIMFDPLCTLAEIVENVRFLLDNDLAQYASGPTSELRLQVRSRYLPILERVEKELGRQLYDRNVEPNTLSFEYEYASDPVARLVATVREENNRSHDLIYRLKGLTRFGDGSLLGDSTAEVRGVLGDYRRANLEALALSADGDISDYQRLAGGALLVAARRFSEIIERQISWRPIVMQAYDVAQVHMSSQSVGHPRPTPQGRNP